LRAPTSRASVSVHSIAPTPPTEAQAIIAAIGQFINSASTPPKAAPLDTPTRSGPTSGLRIMPCRAVPASPSATPEKVATRMRGGRMTVSTVCSRISAPVNVSPPPANGHTASQNTRKARPKDIG
jgi:hypothetical protein